MMGFPLFRGTMRMTMPTFPDPNALNSVAAFHRLFRCPVVDAAALPSSDRCKLRVSLLQEEVQELQDAINDIDLVEVADALADIQYVLSGAVLEFGMGSIFKKLFDEVQRSNMSKACNTFEEAEQTRDHYKNTKATGSYIEKVESTGQWLVYREGDQKVLKSIKYSPADLAPIVKSSSVSSSSSSFPSPVCLDSVAAFHNLFRCPVVMEPSFPSPDRCKLRVSLLREEVQELQDAINDNDLVEVADALADIQYVLSGAILEFGMGSIFKNLFDEVQRSNMSKACKTAEEAEQTKLHYKTTKATDSFIEKVDDEQWLVYREGDRKALKSINYSPADLAGILKGTAPGKAPTTNSSPTSVQASLPTTETGF